MDTALKDPDLLKGAAEIGAWISRSERSVYHLIEQAKLPAFPLGGIWYARKSTLAKFYADLEQQATRMMPTSTPPEPTPMKRKPGRPKGSRNKPKDQTSALVAA